MNNNENTSPPESVSNSNISFARTHPVTPAEEDVRGVSHGLVASVEVREKLAVTRMEAADARPACAGASPGEPMEPTWPRLGDEIVRPRKRNRPWA